MSSSSTTDFARMTEEQGASNAAATVGGTEATTTKVRPTRAPPKRTLSDIPEPTTKSSIGGAMSNLVNSIVGAGIIGIPFALRESGLVVGLLLLVLVSFLTDKSLRIIIETASFHPQLKNIGVKSYEDLMFLPFGKMGSNFVLGSQFIIAYGAMIAYLLIVKDTVPPMVGIDIEHDGAGREIVMFVTSFLIMVPLALKRDMASLSFTSLLSVTGDMILVAFIVFYSPIQESVAAAGGLWKVVGDSVVNSRLFIGLGVISTAMACQHSAFIVSGSLENKTSERWAIVTKNSLSIALLACAVLGAGGYLGFLDDTQGNVLNNFDPDTFAANGARGILAFTMFFTYPMESFVARHVVAKIFYNGNSEGEYMDAEGNLITLPKVFGLIGRREKITIALYCAVLIPALLVDDLGPVLSITGSIGGGCVAYIGPGLVYLGVYGEEFIRYTDNLLRKQPEADPAIELPVAGYANATMKQTQLHPGGSSPESKPFWWWLGLFPIWRAIASAGAQGMKQRFGELGLEEDAAKPPEGEVIYAVTRDYYIAMFFIVFGVVSLLVGVFSNIYVELEGIAMLA